MRLNMVKICYYRRSSHCFHQIHNRHHLKLQIRYKSKRVREKRSKIEWMICIDYINLSLTLVLFD
jgi:hypothetical protein